MSSRRVLLAYERAESPFAAFNVATGDYITVREIADLAINAPVWMQTRSISPHGGLERLEG